MAAKRCAIIGIKAAEMKERQRLSVDEVALSVVIQLAAVQIPVGDVVLGLPHDRVVGQKARGEVKPALIDEVAIRRIDAAVAKQTV